MRTRVYIAGPYTTPDPEKNVSTAIDAGDDLLRAGYAPIIPHLSHFWEARHPHHYEEWMAYDFELLPLCHALLRLPGSSSGADREVALAEKLHIPVFFDLDSLLKSMPPSRHEKGDSRFRALLDQAWELHCRKNADYSDSADNFANYNRAKRFGVPGYMSALLRLGEKMNRIETFCQNGSLANEGIEDTLKDAAAISLIALILYREAQEK